MNQRYVCISVASKYSHCPLLCPSSHPVAFSVHCPLIHSDVASGLSPWELQPGGEGQQLEDPLLEIGFQAPSLKEALTASMSPDPQWPVRGGGRARTPCSVQLLNRGQEVLDLC